MSSTQDRLIVIMTRCKLESLSAGLSIETAWKLDSSLREMDQDSRHRSHKLCSAEHLALPVGTRRAVRSMLRPIVRTWIQASKAPAAMLPSIESDLARLLTEAEEMCAEAGW